MSVSAVSGSVQLFPPVQLNAQVNAKNSDPVAPANTPDPNNDKAVQKQQNDAQQNVTAQSQQAQAQTNNQTSINFFV